MLCLNHIHQSWRPIIEDSLQSMDSSYLNQLEQSTDWLPGTEKIFNAFSLPIDKIKYILFGESPYPRSQSANGFAFWDAAVESLWSDSGLSKQVNRATSLRNFMKLLLVADKQLTQENCNQDAIANVDKSTYINTAEELFKNLLSEGFLLLNTSLVLSDMNKNKEARYWYPFVERILEHLAKDHQQIKLVLWGNIAKQIEKLPVQNKYVKICSEHPYNVSFISNPSMLDFFSKFNLLHKK